MVTHIIRNIPKDMSEIEQNVQSDTTDKDKSGKKKGKKDKKNKKDKKKNDNDEEAKEEQNDEDSEPEDLTYDSEHIAEAIESVKNFISEKGDELKSDKLIEEIHNVCISIGASLDLKYYIAFNSMFSVNILTEFEKHKSIWKSYLSNDGEDGVKNLLMIISRFFTKTYPKLIIAIDTFLFKLYEAEILEDNDVLLKWRDKKFKTDKKSSLYDRKIEKEFKKKADKFFTWLEEAEEDESEEDEDEDENEDKKEDTSSATPELTEQELKAKKMQDLIEQDKLKQEKELQESKAKAEQDKIQKLVSDTDGQEKIDVTAIGDGDGDFDIDDI